MAYGPGLKLESIFIIWLFGWALGRPAHFAGSHKSPLVFVLHSSTEYIKAPRLISDRLMKHIVKIMMLLMAITALWVGLLQTSVLPSSHTWLLPIYFVVSLGCYGLLMVGVDLMQFPTCPQEALLLQRDIVEAKEYLKQRGVDVSSS